MRVQAEEEIPYQTLLSGVIHKRIMPLTQPNHSELPCRHSCESRNPDIFPTQAANQTGPRFSTG